MEITGDSRHADGSPTILRFLPGLDGEERRSEIEAALSQLREVINRLTQNNEGLKHET